MLIQTIFSTLEANAVLSEMAKFKFWNSGLQFRKIRPKINIEKRI